MIIKKTKLKKPKGRLKPKVKISGVSGAAVGGALAGLSSEAILDAVKKLMKNARPTGRPKTPGKPKPKKKFGPTPKFKKKFGPITPKRGKPQFMKK